MVPTLPPRPDTLQFMHYSPVLLSHLFLRCEPHGLNQGYFARAIYWAHIKVVS